MWTEQEAKDKLDQLLLRVGSGEPQVIGGDKPCVVITLAEYERLARQNNGIHLGKWLVENAPRIGDIELPPRHSDRPVPFDDWTEQELAE